jgi:myo-inositol 2-dehydrogenase/D-chiro-inositol 1-dehydrogenase
MREERPVRVGVIGAGRIGRIHAENLALRISGATAAAIADVNLKAAEELAEALRVPVAVADYQAVLQDPTIDAVAICSSTDTHARLISDAALAGKQIFCEKPIDFELARIDQALDAVRRAGVTLQIGFNRRFDPNFRRVRELVAAGKIGEPHLLRITSRDPQPPPIAYVKVSGGIFLDMTIHDFDMARYLIGSEVEEIYAAGSVLVDPRIGEEGDLDTAIITLRFKNGVLAAIDNSRQAVYGYDQRVEVFGSGGMAAASNCTPDNVVYSHGDAVQSAKPLYFFLERYAESFLAEMRAFIESVQGESAPPVGGADGRMATLMGLAARRSYLEKRPVAVTERTAG